MKTLRIHLFGEFRLLYDERPLHQVNQARHQALLAYLLLYRQGPQPRRQIAFTFWPDSPEWKARANLRKLFYEVRRVLPDSDRFLFYDSQTLGWRDDAPFVLDVAELDAVLAQWEKGEQPAPEAVEQVRTLYRGELLPNCYDDWILPLRRAWHERVVNGLEKAVEALEVQGMYTAAIRCAEHLLRLDPLHETTYRQLMRLRALAGDRAGALRVYHECATVLEQELGAQPSAATRATYQQLLSAGVQPVEAKAARPALVEHVPFVGRSAEWTQLQAAWHSAQQRPHMALIAGEAGTGKSRLALELGRWVRLRANPIAYARCYAAEGALAYAPVTEWLRSEALRPGVTGLEDVWLSEVARLLPEILAEHKQVEPPQPLREGWQRQRFHAALVRAVLAAPQPLLLILDDLQWCDEETLAWLHYLLRSDPQAQVLIVCTARSGEIDEGHALNKLRHSLRREALLTEIELNAMSAEETMTLARHLTPGLTPDEAAHLYRETEGNPLFIVEMVRMGMVGAPASPTGHPGETLPPTIRSVIAARLGQLSPVAHQLAQVAAVIGRAFTVDVLAGASRYDITTLVQGLDELWQRRIVREGEQDRYDFSHDKIREVAYGSLSRARRRLLHHQVAETLQRVHAHELDEICGQLAAHYEQAGEIAEAVRYYARAGEVAHRISAYEDAIGWFTRSLALLQMLPESKERDVQELALQTALGAPLAIARGYAAAEVRQTYQRAWTLVQRLGLEHGVPVLRALALINLTVGNPQQAHTLGQQLLQHAQQMAQHPAQADKGSAQYQYADYQADYQYVEAHYLLGVSSFWMGAFHASRTHLEEAITHYNPQWHRRNIELFSHETGAICLVRLALTLWMLGYPEQAMARCQAALAMARTQKHLFSQAYVHNYATWLYLERGELTKAATENEALLALCRQHRLAFWTPTGCVMRGVLLVIQGDRATGLAALQDGLNGFETEEQNLHRPYVVAVAARAYAAAGDPQQGLALAQAGLAAAATTKEHFWDAELYRLCGAILPADRTDEAEAAFQQALSTAHKQGAKSLALRAAVSLARLWQAQGKGQAALQLLAPIYNEFSEGFETADLRDAKSLLASLA